MPLEAVSISLETLVGEAAKTRAEGYRFVTVSCVELDETLVDLLYHFDLDLDLKHLRLTTSRNDPIPSISPVYFAAFLVENEIQDLFGLTFQGLPIDYQHTFYLEQEVKQTPFCKYSVGRSKED